MKIVGYVKTDQGPVVAGAREVDPNKKPTTKIERLNAFFKDVPLHGGKEWETLSVDEIVIFFREVVKEIREEHQKRHDAAVQEHSSLNFLVKGLKEFRGWKEPYVPSEAEIVQDIATRCQGLSSWMAENSTRPFYAGSDMGYLICKPKEVAEQLLKA